MAKTFGDAERRVLEYFRRGADFVYNNRHYVVEESGKPTCSKGEPKTDIYIAATASNRTDEFKISFKKENANFLENKTNADRAEQLFGDDWQYIIEQSTSRIQQEFLNRMLIYKSAFHRTDAGAITLGWKFELLNVPSGDLSGDMHLSRDQVIDIYAGTNLTGDKCDASVNGRTIYNSGVANFILFEEQPIQSTQGAINSMITIEEYVDSHPRVYFACKALNYRTFRNKYDGNRPLAVYVDWHVTNGKLAYDIRFDTPLQQGGDYAYALLERAMRRLGIRTTDDLDSSNVEDPSIIYERE